MNKDTLIVATANAHKLKELNVMSPDYHFIGLHDIGWTEDIVEDGDSFRANALLKAQAIYQRHQQKVIGEDSGLVVPALDGAPGIHSARYAGPDAHAQANNQLLLERMEGVSDRSAYYQSTLCLIEADGSTHYFEGQCHGSIASSTAGDHGFGYDPLFIPVGYDQTFGELDTAIKHRLSHRTAALADLLHYLNSRG